MKELQQTDKKISIRPIETITAEIKDLCRQAQTTALFYAVEIGRRLEEAKAALPYGQWGEWLKNEVEFSQSSANNFMRLYDEYGAAQISFFGASVDSQTFANLPYSKALQLLALPKDEREEFAREVDAENLSVKELKAAIDERDRARKEAEDAKRREAELAEKLAAVEVTAANAEAKEAEAEGWREALESAKKEAEAARAEAKSLADKLSEAKKDPDVPKAMLDKLKKEAEDAAKKAAAEKNEKKLSEAFERVKSAEAEAIAARLEAKRAEEMLSEAEKKIKTASPEVTAFKTLFDSVQLTVKKLVEMIVKVREEDPEMAEKLGAALHAFGQTL